MSIISRDRSPSALATLALIGGVILSVVFLGSCHEYGRGVKDDRIRTTAHRVVSGRRALSSLSGAGAVHGTLPAPGSVTRASVPVRPTKGKVSR
jgi:hypothetical protein